MTRNTVLGLLEDLVSCSKDTKWGAKQVTMSGQHLRAIQYAIDELRPQFADALLAQPPDAPPTIADTLRHLQARIENEADNLADAQYIIEDMLKASLADAPPTETVEAATAHLNEQIQNRADELHVSGYSRDVHRAIDALIAAVRAEYRPEPCADHPTAEMVTVCEACIEEQIAAVRASAPHPTETVEALGYLTRLFQSVAPQCTPLPNLLGVCTQIDNALAWFKERAETAEAELALDRLDRIYRLTQIMAVRASAVTPEGKAP